jgi:hypothetical protein
VDELVAELLAMEQKNVEATRIGLAYPVPPVTSSGHSEHYSLLR